MDNMNKHEQKLKEMVDKRLAIYKTYEDSWDDDAGDGEGAYTIEEPKEIDKLGEMIREFIRIQRDDISCSLILEALTHLGDAPQIIYDDNGNWAVTSNGFSPIPMTDSGKFEGIESFTIVVEPEMWHDTIREALYHYLD